MKKIFFGHLLFCYLFDEQKFKLQWPQYNAYILYNIMSKNQGRFNKLSSAGVKHPLACNIYLPPTNRPNPTGGVPGHFTIFLYLICGSPAPPMQCALPLDLAVLLPWREGVPIVIRHHPHMTLIYFTCSISQGSKWCGTKRTMWS